MNKSELAEAVATSTGVSKTEALASIDAITKVIAKELKGHGSVGLVGFGTFSTTKRAARDGRNPKTGEPLKIKAKTVAKFKPSKDLI